MRHRPERGVKNIAHTPAVLRSTPLSEDSRRHLQLFFLENQKKRLQGELDTLERRHAAVLQALHEVTLETETAQRGPEPHSASAREEAEDERPEPSGRAFRMRY